MEELNNIVDLLNDSLVSEDWDLVREAIEKMEELNDLNDGSLDGYYEMDEG
jgi:hypothetical protein